MESLTARQRQVMELVARGFMNKEIAVDLGIGLQTVKNHLTQSYSRLGAVNRAHAAVLFTEGSRR